MTNYPVKILDADEDPVFQKAYNEGTVDIPAVPIRAIDGPTAPTPVNISFASASPQTLIIAPGVGYRIRITKFVLSSAANVLVYLKSADTVIGTFFGEAISEDYVYPLTLNANTAFVLLIGSADQVYGQVCYWVESTNAI